MPTLVGLANTDTSPTWHVADEVVEKDSVTQRKEQERLSKRTKPQRGDNQPHTNKGAKQWKS